MLPWLAYETYRVFYDSFTRTQQRFYAMYRCPRFQDLGFRVSVGGLGFKVHAADFSVSSRLQAGRDIAAFAGCGTTVTAIGASCVASVMLDAASTLKRSTNDSRSDFTCLRAVLFKLDTLMTLNHFGNPT